MITSLQQPVHVLARAEVIQNFKWPDLVMQYALIEIGECQYVLIFVNPDLDAVTHDHLGDKPVMFIRKEDFGVSLGEANEHGHLFFRDQEQALAWFTTFFEESPGGRLLPLEDKQQEGVK